MYFSKDKKSTINLSNPNDPSFGQCYALFDQTGKEVKREHIRLGKEPPIDWVQVDCDQSCPNNFN